MDPAIMLALAAAGLFAAIGIGVLAAPRFRRKPIQVSLAGVGELSPITVLVSGVASLIVSYHIVAYALGVMAHFRAPLWIVFVGAAVAVLGSIGLDAVDNRRDLEERDSDRED